jgi:hypothetical protein
MRPRYTFDLHVDKKAALASLRSPLDPLAVAEPHLEERH